MYSHLRATGPAVLALLLHFDLWVFKASAQVDLFSNTIVITSATRWGLFRESDVITNSTTDGSPITITSIEGMPVYEGPSIALQLPRGHYFVETTNDRAQFAVLPDDYHGATFIGCDAPTAAVSYPAQKLSRAQPVWQRANIAWDIVQPTPTTWNWSPLDAVVDLAYQNGRKLMVTTYKRPPWLADDSRFVSRFDEYLRRMCQRYGNKIYAIEVWNEPNTRAGLWLSQHPEYWIPFENSADDVPAAYINVLNNAYFTIKGVNPNIKVYGAGWATPVTEDFIERFAELGGQTYLDGFTFHDYYMRQAPPDEATLLPDGLRPRIDQIVAKYRSMFGAKDLVMNEGGFYGESALGIPNTQSDSNVTTMTSGLPWYRGMYRTIKSAVMYRAAGVLGVMPHAFTSSGDDPNNNFEIFGWEFGERGPHPKTSAYLMTGYWLDDATFVDYRVPGANTFLYAWQLPDNTSLLIAWAQENQSVPLVTGSLPPATDIFGRTVDVTALTEEPVLFHSSNPDASDLLRTIRSKIAGITNLAPVFDSLPTKNVVAGQSLHFTLPVTDPDNDPITCSALELPSGATFDPDTHTFSWTPGKGTSGSYNITFVATDDKGASPSNTVTVTVLGSLFDGLIAHWKLDEVSGTSAADSAGTNNGTLVNFDFAPSSPWGRANRSRGLAFDGVDDFVGLDSGQLHLTNGFTIALWVKPENAAGIASFFGIRSYYQQSGIRFFFSGNSLLLQGETAAGWQSTYFANTAISNSVWYYVAVVYDHSYLNVYLNGALRGSVNWGGDLVMDAANISRLGSDNGYYFPGAIDDVMIFGRVLTASQIRTLYHPNNSAPILKQIKPKLVRAGRRVQIRLKAKDIDHDPLTYSMSPLPAGSTFDVLRHKFTWVTTNATVGIYSFTASVTDGIDTDTEPVTITVY